MTSIDVPRSELARVASDHLPLVAEVRIQPVQDGMVRAGHFEGADGKRDDPVLPDADIETM